MLQSREFLLWQVRFSTQPPTLVSVPHLHGPSAVWLGHSSVFTGVTSEQVHGRVRLVHPFLLPASPSGHIPVTFHLCCLDTHPALFPFGRPSAQSVPCSPGLLHSRPPLSLLSGTALPSPPGLISPCVYCLSLVTCLFTGTQLPVASYDSDATKQLIQF